MFGYNISLGSNEIITVSGELGYSQYLCTASHDNKTPSLAMIISGSTNYYGVHSRILYLDSLKIEDGIRGDGKMKISNPTSSAYKLSFIPLATTIPLEIKKVN